MIIPIPHPERPNAKKGRGYVLLPIQIPKAWNLYKTLQSDFWVAEDVILAPGYDKRESSHPSAIVLAELATAIRRATLPEKMSAMIHNSEIACFLGFQAMQENIHVEVVTHSLSTDDERARPASDLVPSQWPKPSTLEPAKSVPVLHVLEYAATYAAITAITRTALAECETTPVIADVAFKIARDSQRAYEFAVYLCAVIKAELKFDDGSFLELAEAMIDLVMLECKASKITFMRLPSHRDQLVSIPDKPAVGASFADDIKRELETFQPLQLSGGKDVQVFTCNDEF